MDSILKTITFHNTKFSCCCRCSWFYFFKSVPILVFVVSLSLCQRFFHGCNSVVEVKIIRHKIYINLYTCQGSGYTNSIINNFLIFFIYSSSSQKFRVETICFNKFLSIKWSWIKYTCTHAYTHISYVRDNYIWVLLTNQSNKKYPLYAADC